MARKTGRDAVREIDRPKEDNTPKEESLLSSGSTLLNLGLTGKVDGAFYAGKYYLFVGDSSSGKSFYTLATFAEASLNPFYKHHRLIHDNAEDGALMNFPRFFGRRMAERIEPPRGSRKNPRFSTTAEELYYNIDYAFDEEVPFIYVVDSMDALDTEDDQERFEQQRKAHEGTAKEAGGSYGMAKAKLNKAGLRRVFSRLKGSDSIIIFISQTVANVDRFTAKFNPTTRSGGKAMTFFNHGEIWTKVGGHLTTHVGDRTEELGVYSIIKVKKNRQTGRQCEVTVPILWSSGIDDLGSCVDYLLEIKHWKEAKGAKITAPEFNAEGVGREDLIQSIIQAEGGEAKLRRLVGMVWRDVERRITPERPMRYSDE